MQKIIPALIIPLLVVLASAGCFLILRDLGIFEAVGIPEDKGFLRSILPAYYALSLPICVYISSLVVWMFNRARKDIVASIVAFSAVIGFLLGALVLTSFAGVGFNAIEVLELFFRPQGIYEVIPSLAAKLTDSPKQEILIQMFWYLMTPAIFCVVGMIFGCQFRREKPTGFGKRLKTGILQMVGAIVLVYLLFFPMISLLGGSPFPGRFASMQARNEWAMKTFQVPSYRTVVGGLTECSIVKKRIGTVKAIAPTVGGNWSDEITRDSLAEPEARFVIEVVGEKGTGIAKVNASGEGAQWDGELNYRTGSNSGVDKIEKACDA